MGNVNVNVGSSVFVTNGIVVADKGAVPDGTGRENSMEKIK